MPVSRRSFIKGLGASSLISQIGWAAPSGLSTTDFKALVCVDLAGGNDGFNMLVPTSESHYNEYATIRQTVKIDKDQLLPTPLRCLDRYGASVELGLHPSMSELAQLCDKGYVNALINCGVLKRPMTPADKGNEPSMLFSHNSQSSEWKRGDSNNGGLTSGWGQRLMQQFVSSSSLPSMYSLSGNSRLFRGALKSNSLSAGGAKGITMTPYVKTRFEATLDEPRSEQFREHFRGLMRDSVYTSSEINSILSVDSGSELSKDTDNSLALQLDSVCKFIENRVTLGQNRQVFYVSLGGFDTHSNQAVDHAELLSKLSRALKNFYDVLDLQGVSSQVATVTMSDFGRRIIPNSTGTDHGWGNNNLLISGAPLASHTTGVWPSLQPKGDDDFSSGRLIPTTSIDQIGATLAAWMGVPESELSSVFPNLGRFSPQVLPIFA